MSLFRASNILVPFAGNEMFSFISCCNPYSLNVILETGRKRSKFVFITCLSELGSSRWDFAKFQAGLGVQDPCLEVQGQLLEDSECELMPNPKVPSRIYLYKSSFSVCLCKGSLIFCISSKYNSFVCPEWTMWKIKWCFPFPGGEDHFYDALSYSISLLQGNKVTCSMCASSRKSFKTHLPETLWTLNLPVPSQPWRI